jgi:hypothetical protein
MLRAQQIQAQIAGRRMMVAGSSGDYVLYFAGYLLVHSHHLDVTEEMVAHALAVLRDYFAGEHIGTDPVELDIAAKALGQLEDLNAVPRVLPRMHHLRR